MSEEMKQAREAIQKEYNQKYEASGFEAEAFERGAKWERKKADGLLKALGLLEALEEIRSCTGTSTLQYKLSSKAISEYKGEGWE